MSETAFKSTILTELSWRGLIKQQTHPEALDASLCDGPVVLYCGFDPTAESLHVGNLLPIMGLAFFRRHGHTPLALAGGATGMIGDPSGKDEERNLQTQAQLDANLAGISAQLRRLLDRALDMHAEGVADGADRGVEVPVLNNADWVAPWSFIDFLREVGKFFRVNQMVQMDSVRTRLEAREQGISYTEFSYMLLQGFDFFHLFQERGCTLQIGGSDQWGNITMGTDLIRRKAGGEAFGMTMPLVTDAEGKKIGKTQGEAVWLDPERTSPYAFYQYWVNLPDADMATMLPVFTFLPKDEIDALLATIEAGENRGDVQRTLAYEVTSFVHGAEEADRAVRSSKMLFGEQISDLSDRDLASIFAHVPSTNIERARLEEGVKLVDLLCEVKLQGSKSQARRLVSSAGAYINNVAQDSIDRVVTLDDLASESMLVLRSGKKKYHVIHVA